MKKYSRVVASKGILAISRKDQPAILVTRRDVQERNVREKGIDPCSGIRVPLALTPSSSIFFFLSCNLFVVPSLRLCSDERITGFKGFFLFFLLLLLESTPVGWKVSPTPWSRGKRFLRIINRLTRTCTRCNLHKLFLLPVSPPGQL